MLVTLIAGRVAERAVTLAEEILDAVVALEEPTGAPGRLCSREPS